MKGRSAALLVAVCLGAAACSIQERTDRGDGPVADAEAAPTSEFIAPWGESEPPRAVRSGNLIWIWGMVGSVPGQTPPRLAEGGAGAETRQALANIAEILRAGGAELREVAQCSAFLADAADLAPMTEAYREYFPSAPARTAVAVGDLALGARVELECTAGVEDGR